MSNDKQFTREQELLVDELLEIAADIEDSLKNTWILSVLSNPTKWDDSPERNQWVETALSVNQFCGRVLREGITND